MDEKAVAASFAEKYGLEDDAAIELLANAIRLFQDAVLLYENGRYASARSLAVLALEEAAKFMGLADIAPLARNSWRDHTAKHVGSASFLLMKRYRDALQEVLGLAGIEHFDRLADFRFTDDDLVVLDEVVKRITADGTILRYKDAREKRLDLAKQAGFYVDVDADDHVVSTPASVTAEQAYEQMTFARDLFVALEAHLPSGPPGTKKPSTKTG
jgi:AbiV family abortive infection protein